MDPNANRTLRKIAEEPRFHQRESVLDAESFGQIHRDYWDRLINSLTGLVRDRDKAEDIASRAFEVAWEKRDEFRGEASPSTWIQAIARHDAQRSRNRERVGRFDSIDRDDARELAAAELVTDELEKRDDRWRLKLALDHVPLKYRRALIAHFVDGLSIREIAQCEHLPPGTVLSRIFTAKQLLRHAWKKTTISAPQTGLTRREEERSPQPQKRQESQRLERSAQERPESLEPPTWGR